MYLYIGNDFIINNSNIVSIINIDYVKNTKEFKGMCNKLKEENHLYDVSNNKNKTCILTEEKGVKKAYITNISVNTILKRLA